LRDVLARALRYIPSRALRKRGRRAQRSSCFKLALVSACWVSNGS